MKNQKETYKISGQFSTQDKQGTPIILDWRKTTLLSSEFANEMKAVWDLARKAYTPVEINFLRKYPQVVGTEDYFKPFETLFKDGINKVDWAKAEEIMQEILKSHFIFDVSQLSPEIIKTFEKDTCYIVTAKDLGTKKLLGFITFIIRANYTQGDIKVMSFAVDPEYQNRGLGKLLTSLIFKINTNIKRIFLCTRVTNNIALNAYKNWGFTLDSNPILDHTFNLEHWTFLEYKIDKTNILQKIAEGLKEIK